MSRNFNNIAPLTSASGDCLRNTSQRRLQAASARNSSCRTCNHATSARNLSCAGSGLASKFGLEALEGCALRRRSH
eukprot:15451977-Alexandrium_andersonii.AAC.1